MHKVLFTDKAKRDLKSFDKSLQNRIVNKLKEYSSDPYKYARKLTDISIGSYRFRIGDYRIAFDIEKEDIIILRIRHRKDIYR
jgi:mRNA interferase RelE/StbE